MKIKEKIKLKKLEEISLAEIRVQSGENGESIKSKPTQILRNTKSIEIFLDSIASEMIIPEWLFELPIIEPERIGF